MQHVIHGTTLQTLEIKLEAGESIFSQTHQMAWMSDHVKMQTSANGGLVKGLMRSLAGSSLFLTQFKVDRASGLVAFCPRFPGTIIARELKQHESLICRKETFLCAEASVELGVFFRQQLGSGLFGGEGFVLQEVTGPGWVFLDLSGEVVEKNLAPNEILHVHAGHVGVQEPSVEFSITMMKGFRNVLFGGEGVFLATLQGPGKVMLQSMPIMILAEEILRHAHHHGGDAADAGGGAGKVVHDILGGIFGGEK